MRDRIGGRVVQATGLYDFLGTRGVSPKTRRRGANVHVAVDEAPRVFLSYSDDSARHAERVLELAQWLRSHGVDARVDQFEHSPEEGWPRWIYRQIRESHFVLVVCTPEYLSRCEGEVPRARGADKAVKFESHLSLQEIHDAEGRNRKFVPVLFDDADVGECVPLPLRGATFYRLPEQREDLYRRLSDQPKVRAAPLGPRRTIEDDSIESFDESEPLPSESVELVISAPPRRRHAKRAGSWQRLLVAGVIGVGILAAAMFVSGVGTSKYGGSSDKCSIQLTDPDGSTIDDLSGISLILPAGGKIEVTVEGNTLYFECPKVAVNARVHVDRGAAAHHAETSAKLDPSQPANMADEEVYEAAAAETQILISPQPGLQRIPLDPPKPQQRWSEFEFQPDDVPIEPPDASGSADDTRALTKKKPRTGSGDGPK
jgi:hypothetical protein